MVAWAVISIACDITIASAMTYLVCVTKYYNIFYITNLK